MTLRRPHRPLEPDTETDRFRAPLNDPAGRDFETFYRTHYRNLVGLGVVLIGDRGVAEDLTQEALVKVHDHWDRLTSYDDPLAWTRRVLANSATSRGRRATTEARLRVRLRAHRAPALDLPDPDVEMWDLVRALPRRQAQVLALRYWDDLANDEIARVLDIGAESVKTHLTRGRATLRAQLEGRT